MRFFSDNAAPAHPAVMEAIVAANTLDTAYDGDGWSQQLDDRLSSLFGTKVQALWVPSGTAANCLALAAMCPPHGAIVCHRDAHIQNDECGAPEFYTHGAKLLLGEGEGAKLTPESVKAVLDATRDDVHQTQPHVVSLTNATEYGRVYSPDDVAAIHKVVEKRGLKLHMDGARFANAVATLGCKPADVTWRAGVDALSFGFVKNGGMSAEALVFFGKRDTCVALSPQARRAAAQQGPLSRRADPGDAGRRSVAGECARRQCRRGAAGARGGRSADPSGRGQRGVPARDRGRGGGLARAGLRFLRLGAGRGAAGDLLGSGRSRDPPAGGRDRGVVMGWLLAVPARSPARPPKAYPDRVAGRGSGPAPYERSTR